MSKYIAPYILKKEYACHHCSVLPPGLDQRNVSFIFTMLFDRFANIRKQWGRPLNISSGYRCPTYQRFLWNVGQSDSPLSVHIFGLALDIDANDEDGVHRLVSIATAIDPDMRIGYQRYLAKKQTFMHMDIGYLINPVYSYDLHEGARW